ncbi:VOC family protein [Variovorax dokdonensis]|uniref:VOC family protein n=1 Tax=Variovorax dokdonensis TaxID=344883 RepID=A0ABT7NGP0_9BURK|nr:VOC family protein [Variovorax dokdonensis]MDM0047077.1 VOC family protein [Variovorax dokdonensis]
MKQAVVPHAEVDHLVVAGATLADCEQWCEATLGIAPGPGGQHPLMGTHNRLLDVSGPRHPCCYLELIAIEPGAPTARAAGLRRWFDLDDPLLQQRLHEQGPRLIHFVARVPDAASAVQALAHCSPPIDRGTVIQASRDSAAGKLEWQITVRDDGQRLMHGLVPTLIQWGRLHPADDMPPSGLTLQQLTADHPEAGVLADAYARIGLGQVPVESGPPRLTALLQTPRGMIELTSDGI